MKSDGKKVALISCVSEKERSALPAKDLYVSRLFRGAYQYAKQIGAEKIFILSARYGLVEETEVIAPYDETLNSKPIADRKAWAAGVLESLNEKTDLQKDEFVILAGKKYREFLVDQLANVSIPLEGMSIGKQLDFYKKRLASEQCGKLHSLVKEGKRFTFETGFDGVPENGIYIMFEKGETGHGGERIVRIGTHRGENELKSRVKQHFVMENKNRSIFRKNIGRCFLHQDANPYLAIWNYDMTTKEYQERYGNQVDDVLEKKIESEISSYIRENISFRVLQVLSREDRKKYESQLIGTVANCIDCQPSANWLGRQSPERKIRESGLWQKEHLGADPLNDQGFAFISAALLRD